MNDLELTRLYARDYRALANKAWTAASRFPTAILAVPRAYRYTGRDQEDADVLLLLTEFGDHHLYPEVEELITAWRDSNRDSASIVKDPKYHAALAKVANSVYTQFKFGWADKDWWTAASKWVHETDTEVPSYIFCSLQLIAGGTEILKSREQLLCFLDAQVALQKGG